MLTTKDNCTYCFVNLVLSLYSWYKRGKHKQKSEFKNTNRNLTLFIMLTCTGTELFRNTIQEYFAKVRYLSDLGFSAIEIIVWTTNRIASEVNCEYTGWPCTSVWPGTSCPYKPNMNKLCRFGLAPYSHWTRTTRIDTKINPVYSVLTPLSLGRVWCRFMHQPNPAFLLRVELPASREQCSPAIVNNFLDVDQLGNIWVELDRPRDLDLVNESAH